MDVLEVEEELALLRGEEPTPTASSSPEDFEAQMLAWVAAIAALSVEEADARYAELNARHSEVLDLIDAERLARNAPPEPAVPPPAAVLEALPSPSGPLPEPSRPYGLHILTDAERADPNEWGHPSWRRER